jgi:hypothetical protein
MALTPFGFMLVGEPAFGPSSRELRKLNKAFEGWTSALMPAFDQLPVQAAATTAMVSVLADQVMADVCAHACVLSELQGCCYDCQDACLGMHEHNCCRPA